MLSPLSIFLLFVSAYFSSSELSQPGHSSLVVLTSAEVEKFIRLLECREDLRDRANCCLGSINSVDEFLSKFEEEIPENVKNLIENFGKEKE